MSNRNISIVHWFPELEKHKCGYCKQINSNCSYGKSYFNLSNYKKTDCTKS